MHSIERVTDACRRVQKAFFRLALYPTKTSCISNSYPILIVILLVVVPVVVLPVVTASAVRADVLEPTPPPRETAYAQLHHRRRQERHTSSSSRRPTTARGQRHHHAFGPAAHANNLLTVMRTVVAARWRDPHMNTQSP